MQNRYAILQRSRVYKIIDLHQHKESLWRNLVSMSNIDYPPLYTYSEWLLDYRIQSIYEGNNPKKDMPELFI